jgi:putative ABC transport system permease protein
MKTHARGATEGSKFGAGKILVMAQVALSLVLLVGAGLMLSTFWRLASLDPGFDRDRVLITGIDLRNGHYPPGRRLTVFREMLEKARSIPGVRSASASVFTPICGCRWRLEEVAIEGYTAKSREDATVAFDLISDRYFQTLGTAIVAGRDFNLYDTPDSPPVAIVNTTMARKYFGAANPIGRRYRVQKGERSGSPVEIVGVVKDAKSGSLREEIPPTIYVAWGQNKTPGPLTNFELRTAGGAPTALIAAVKSAIGEVNRGVSLEFTRRCRPRLRARWLANGCWRRSRDSSALWRFCWRRSGFMA